MPSSLELAPECRHLRAFPTVESGFGSIFMIMDKNMGFMICIPVDFIRLRLWKSSGLTGADTFISTVIWMRQSQSMKGCLS